MRFAKFALTQTYCVRCTYASLSTVPKFSPFRIRRIPSWNVADPEPTIPSNDTGQLPHWPIILGMRLPGHSSGDPGGDLPVPPWFHPTGQPR